MKAAYAMAAAAATAFFACNAFAGEDSTDRWGAGGTGVTIWESRCGLHIFPGPVDDAQAQRPCGYAGPMKDRGAKPETTEVRQPASAGATQAGADSQRERKDR